MGNMKLKIVWFLIGAASSLFVVYTWAWTINRPSNAVAQFSPEIQEGMLFLMPWLESAKGAQVGPYIIATPSDAEASPEAIIWSKKNEYPQLVLAGNDISIIGSQNKMISIKVDPESGMLKSYDFSPDLMEGLTFFDTDSDGQYDVKLQTGEVGQMGKFSVHHQSKWYPVTTKEKKRFIEIDSVSKELKFETGFVWKFVE